MTHDSQRPSRSGSNQDLWPKWMWIAVPVLVVVVVAGLWWAIFSPPDTQAAPTPTPTLKILPNQPTQPPTTPATLVPESDTTRQALPDAPTFTPTALLVTTPTAGGPTVAAASSGDSPTMAVGANVKVISTGALGLNMRAGAGTGHARVKTQPDGTKLEVIGGPKEASGYTWWQVRDEAGTTGWVASKFLELD